MFAGERVLEFVGNRLNFCVKMFSEAVCGIYLYLVILSYAPASRESDVHISLLKNKNKKKISQMKYKQLSI